MTEPTPTSPPQSGFARFAKYYRPHLSDIVLGLVFLLGASLLEPLIPAMMKLLLDHTSANTQGVKVQAWPVWGPPLAVIGLFAGRSVLVFLSHLALGSASNKAVLGLQRDVFERLLVCDLSLYQRESASSLINTVRSECTAAGQTFISVVQDGGRNLLTSLALLGYLFWMNWKLTLVTLTIMPLVAVVVRLIGQRMRRINQAQQKAADALSYVIEENTAAHRMVRLYGAEQQERSRFERANQNLRAQLTRSLAAATAMTPVTQIAASLALALILSIALQQNEAGVLSVGGLAAYITAMLMLIAPLKGLGDAVPNLHRGRVALERIYQILDYAVEAPGGNHAPQQVRGDIEFCEVFKRYDAAAHPAVDGVSLKIGARQMVALVGASGSGKTTLANMLPCFVRPDGGRILLDGVDIHDWQLSTLRQQMAMVSQDTVLLNDTVLANVCLGSAAQDRARAEQALKNAYLWDHVRAMPMGLDSEVGHNGQQLSGGQRQRLAIARALYKASPILILDEATSALDSESERLVQQAIGDLAHQCTLLVIAHRLSTVRHADVIVVMEAGKIVEQGSYDELVASQGIFARLISQQLSA
jgi:ATP-binding cassette, subfamily B, bacterial MsbA